MMAAKYSAWTASNSLSGPVQFTRKANVTGICSPTIIWPAKLFALKPLKLMTSPPLA